ncbi:MAG: hypothetical protein H8E31_11670, partial [Planctomycetes bacterium]|nr:hypothetical protein [Planctomycetota bacterium]
MTRLLVLTSAGLLSWPLWPEAWRLGLGIGWCCSLALELAVYARRRRLMAAEADARSYQGLLLVQVAGFLAKLLAVAAGGAAPPPPRPAPPPPRPPAPPPARPPACMPPGLAFMRARVQETCLHACMPTCLR